MAAEFRDNVGNVVIKSRNLALVLKHIITFGALMAEIIDGVHILL